ncbi:putative mitochondrial hypothetical protein [Leptomonas pyrrhocoris]|uniref:Uncharacterized protein n=1 Tax=Leptomonas pyrrhocoris TaxID=157538 RepID=A0A0N0DUR5_LEPPY|nr:putative mitochondrial hypothetical protein [Leptomonas pyrrhocoris]KPA78954.1 putative mitochondrial hypothetical protein [Leptomonas pyrrhocoris]|eukprot:XP_015657393.1 putative mitochondrial hypothetical protein [Leptomonas pyrrhocoris]
MARGKGRSQQAAADSSSMQNDAAPTAVSVTAPDAAPQHDAVTMKEALTAPFMIYDAQARRIVPNPAYNRTLLREVRRLQSITLTKLRAPMQANASYTPKELLYELEAALFYICASAAVTSNADGLKYLTSDAEADAVMPQLESFLAHHSAPAKTTVALAYCLTEGTSHEVLTSFISMVQQRVEGSLDPAIDRKRTEDEHKALRATKNNIHDIAQLLRDVATTYHSIDTPSQMQRRQPQSDPTQVDVARSPAANAVPARMLDEAFYKVLRWVMAVDTDRRALKAAASMASGHGGGAGGQTQQQRQRWKEVSAVAAAVASAVSASDAAISAPAAVAAASTQGFAKVVDYDPFTGQATLERAAEGQRWGLLLNAKGLLVGLENELRNSSEAGERLYDAVQQQSKEAGGLAIYEVNRRRIRPVHLTDDELTASQADMLQKLRKSLSQPTKLLHLSIEKRKQADLTSPHEVLYEVSYQGGENSVGQRCLLMLERASASIPWGLKLKYAKGTPAVLSDFSPNIRFSAAAKNFLFDTRGRVRVLRMNSKDLSKLTAAEMKTLVSGALVLTLNLQVTDADGEVPEGAADATAAAEDGAEERPPETIAELDEAEDVGVQAAATAADDEIQVKADEKSTEVEPMAEEEALEAAAATTVPSAAQAELDDVAAAIADEFLLQHDVADDAASPNATEPAAKLSKKEKKGAVNGGEAFEELDWAKPTTTFGASGEEDLDDGGGDEADATRELGDTEEEGEEPGAAGADEHAAERALLKEHHLLQEGESGDEGHAETGDDAVMGESADAALAEDGVTDDETKVVEEEAALKALEEDAPAKKPRKGRKAKGEKAEPEKKKQGGKEKKTRGRKKKTSTAEKPKDAAAEDASVEAEDATDAAEVTDSEDAAPGEDGADDTAAAAAVAQTAGDVPLVDLPPTAAEVAMEVGKKNAERNKRGGKSKAKEGEEEAENEESAETAQEIPASSLDSKADATAIPEDDVSPSSTRVSLNELVHAAPLTFENNVKLDKFDGSTLELERTSVASPWNIKVAFAGDDIIMTKLPPIPAAQRQHPFLRSLGAGAQGEVKWVVEGLNGQDLSMMSKTLKTKALDAIKGSTKLTFVLKALRK